MDEGAVRADREEIDRLREREGCISRVLAALRPGCQDVGTAE